MTGTMWRRLAIAGSLTSCLVTVPAGSAAAPVILGWAGSERLALVRAVDGAARRLAQPDCQRVLDDFTDPSGHTLGENLAQLDKTPVEFFNELYFTDDRDSSCCTRGRTLAFTAPGLRVIRICGLRFAAVSLSRPAYGDAVLIHEMLHALGLGENPPTSADITRQVLARCS